MRSAPGGKLQNLFAGNARNSRRHLLSSRIILFIIRSFLDGLGGKKRQFRHLKNRGTPPKKKIVLKIFGPSFNVAPLTMTRLWSQCHCPRPKCTCMVLVVDHLRLHNTKSCYTPGRVVVLVPNRLLSPDNMHFQQRLYLKVATCNIRVVILIPT